RRTPLQVAAELRHADIVAHLLSKQADVHAPPAPCKGLTALQAAAKGGFYLIAERLIEQSADINAPAARIHGRTAFEAATEFGRLDVMILLVRNGADLMNSDGQRQFDRAVKFAEAEGNDPAVKL
ncbi:ankyrin, partial [Bimuria novae-zelandiae CBS 107.79]